MQYDYSNRIVQDEILSEIEYLFLCYFDYTNSLRMQRLISRMHYDYSNWIVQDEILLENILSFSILTTQIHYASKVIR